MLLFMCGGGGGGGSRGGGIDFILLLLILSVMLVVTRFTRVRSGTFTFGSRAWHKVICFITSYFVKVLLCM